VTPARPSGWGTIDTSAAHLLSIINDILDISKIEAGKLVLEQTDFTLGASSTRSALVEDARQAKGLTARSRMRERAPSWLRGDPMRLQPGAAQLLRERRQIHRERPRITLRARLLEERAAEVLLRFEVRDSGIGIDG
jgi:two-component system sensor histidine kinase/response regulator